MTAAAAPAGRCGGAVLPARAALPAGATLPAGAAPPALPAAALPASPYTATPTAEETHP
ncbi:MULTISPECIES: hypothetical protein [unclassified Streptomyces]|uniref:hypothetical protein n=1 Tax=unclassified Streptomyces TaxID=2593676 RepID=UPI002256F1CC|nr:hypothetical protein [Streptomyces sp. NBC_00047]MCX5609132.1 hypothetical protein [Streptomyces sp. NBC_00047]